MKNLKKYFTVFLTFATVLWSLGPIAPAIPVAHAGVPTVTGGIPDNQTNVPLDALIDVQFSEALSVPTVTTSNVSLQLCTGASDAITCANPAVGNLCETVAISNNTGIVCTASSLAVNQTYLLTITNSVTSAFGDPLAANVTKIFRTGATDFSTNTAPLVVQQTSFAPGTNTYPTNAPIVFIFPANKIINNPGHAIINLRTRTNGVLGAQLCTSDSNCSVTAAGNALNVRLQSGGSNANLTANTLYDVCVVGGANGAVDRDANTLTADACYGFGTAGADSTAPTLLTNGTTPLSGATAVNRYLSEARVRLNEAVVPSDVTVSNVRIYNDGNSDSAFTGGELLLTGGTDYQVRYDGSAREIILEFGVALASATRYCFLVSGISDLAGNAMATSENQCFTTGSQVDSTGPTALYADADNFLLAIEFDEPVARSGATTNSNYAMSCGAAGGGNTTTVNLASKVITAQGSHVEIQNLGLTPGQQCSLTITGLTDLASNGIITANSANVLQFIVLDAQQTGGFVGSGGAQQDYQNSDFGSLAISPERGEPRSRKAGRTGIAEFQFPAPAAMPAGSVIILTFPSGFELSSVIAAANAYSNADLNGPATGTPTIASVTASGQSVTITTASATIAANDQIRFELDRVTNPATPASNLRITAVVKVGGIKQGQTVQPTPFAIAAAGNRTIGGTVYKDTNANGSYDAGEGLANVVVFSNQQGSFGGGSFGGHDEATTDANGAWTMTVSDGRYGIGIPPPDFSDAQFSDLSSKGNQFRDITVNGGNVTGIDFAFTDLSSSGATATINITGGPASTQLMVGMQAGFNASVGAPMMKPVTTDGTGAATVTMKVPSGTEFEVFVGPYVDPSNFKGGGSGTPIIPDFNFMPPAPQRLIVPASGNPAALTFAIEVASNTISGTIQDGSGNGLANIMVDGVPLGCFDASDGSFKECSGGFGQSRSDGTFTLNVSAGSYAIRAFGPGMPPSNETIVTVTDSNVTGVIIKMAKTSLTIAGAVQDEDSNGIQAGVEGQRVAAGGTCASFTPRGQHTFSPTDSSGNYTLYVSAGTWKITAFSPSYGQVDCAIVVVSDASKTGENLQASAANYKTISGTGPEGAHVGAWGPSGGNHAVVSGGTYSINVSAGVGYTVECHLQGSGPCGRQQNVDTTSANQTVNFSTSITTGTLTVYLCTTNEAGTACASRQVTEGFVDARDASGLGSGTSRNNGGVYTLKLAAPASGSTTYTIKGGNPRVGRLCGTTTVSVDSAGTVTPSSVTCAPSGDLRSISARITDGTANLAGATATLTNSTGKVFNVTSGNQSGSNTNLSAANVPDGTYTIRASKKGYESTAVSATVSGGNLTISTPLALTQATGTDGASVTVTVQDSDNVTFAGDGLVIATKGSGSTARTVVEAVDKTSGTAALGLTNGTWTVKSVSADGKQSDETTVTVTNGSAGSAPTLGLDNTISGFTAVRNTAQVSPKSGFLLESEDVPGLKVNAPAGAFSTTDTSANITIANNPGAANVDPGEDQDIQGTVYDIDVKDSNSKEYSSTSAVEVTLPYTAASGVTNPVVAYLDDNGEWQSLPTTEDTDNNQVVFETTHFSTFAILGTVAATTSAANTDRTAPSKPSNVATTTNGTSVTLTWTDATDSDLSDILIYRGVGALPVSGNLYARVDKGVKTYTDTAVEAGMTYKYIVRSRDQANNIDSNIMEYSIVATAGSSGTTTSSTTTTIDSETSTTTTTPATTTETSTSTTTTATTSVSTDSRAAQLTRVLSQATDVFTKAIADVASAAGKTRDTALEATQMSIVDKVVSSGVDASVKGKVTAFVVYGTDDTQVHGAGQRAAVVNSFRAAFDRDPASQDDWNDILKLAAGRFPGQTNEAREASVLSTFESIYKRAADRANPNDNAAIVTMAYGLQQSAENRNLDSERAGISTFTNVYGYTPTTASHWDAVRAIAYSGATR